MSKGLRLCFIEILPDYNLAFRIKLQKFPQSYRFFEDTKLGQDEAVKHKQDNDKQS